MVFTYVIVRVVESITVRKSRESKIGDNPSRIDVLLWQPVPCVVWFVGCLSTFYLLFLCSSSHHRGRYTRILQLATPVSSWWDSNPRRQDEGWEEIFGIQLGTIRNSTPTNVTENLI